MSYGTCGLSADVGTSAIRLAVFGGPQRFENFGTGVRELRIFVLSSGKNIPAVCLSPSTKVAPPPLPWNMRLLVVWIPLWRSSPRSDMGRARAHVYGNSGDGHLRVWAVAHQRSA